MNKWFVTQTWTHLRVKGAQSGREANPGSKVPSDSNRLVFALTANYLKLFSRSHSEYHTPLYAEGSLF